MFHINTSKTVGNSYVLNGPDKSKKPAPACVSMCFCLCSTRTRVCVCVCLCVRGGRRGGGSRSVCLPPHAEVTSLSRPSTPRIRSPHTRACVTGPGHPREACLPLSQRVFQCNPPSSAESSTRGLMYLSQENSA